MDMYTPKPKPRKKSMEELGFKVTNYQKPPEEVKKKIITLIGLLEEMNMRKESGCSRKVNPFFLSEFFTFEMKDQEGNMHEFLCEENNFKELITYIIELRRMVKFDPKNPPKIKIMYEDEDGDKIVIASDSDLKEAVDYARETGKKVLKLDWEINDPKPQSVWDSIGPAVLGASGLGILAFFSKI